MTVLLSAVRLGAVSHQGDPDATAGRVWGLLARGGMSPSAAYDVHLAVRDTLATSRGHDVALDLTVDTAGDDFELKVNRTIGTPARVEVHRVAYDRVEHR